MAWPNEIVKIVPKRISLLHNSPWGTIKNTVYARRILPRVYGIYYRERDVSPETANVLPHSEILTNAFVKTATSNHKNMVQNTEEFVPKEETLYKKWKI